MSGCRIIDGRRIAAEIETETGMLIASAGERRRPCIVAVSIGNDPAAASYIRQKERAMARLSIEFRIKSFSSGVSKSQVSRFIEEASSDRSVDAVMVLSPVPQGYDIDELADIIPPGKDVDCMSTYSRGLLYSGRPLFSPATAEAVIEIMKHESVPVSGRHVVILGRSLVTGRPLASLLLMKGKEGDATVTVCHSRTEDLPRITRSADVLVAATGRPLSVAGTMIREGTVVIDVGISEIAVPGKQPRIVGDVDFESVSKVASALTPVPGGVGPVTTAVLMRNVVRAWSRSLS